MSSKHKIWAWMRIRKPGSELALLLIFSIFPRRLHGNTSGKVDAESVGYGLAVGGALFALSALIGLIFLPLATFPVLYAEFLAILGIALLGIGIVVHAAD